MNLKPNRFRSIPTPPHNPEIIAGYSQEMLDGAIKQLSDVPRPGAWEIERLKILKKERDRRSAPSTKAKSTSA